MVWTIQASAIAPAGAEPFTPGKPKLHISAQVDQTAVDLGSELTLTITIEGDFAKAELRPLQFPKAFQVTAQSQASNISFQLGNVKRSLSLVYVLAPQEAGTFQLGPFEAVHRGKSFFTDPLEILVTKPILPPKLEEHERFLL